VIPRDYITGWRVRAPWADNAQVEQDLAICRALVSIFSHPVLNDALAFRGGTALYKFRVLGLEFLPVRIQCGRLSNIKVSAIGSHRARSCSCRCGLIPEHPPRTVARSDIYDRMNYHGGQQRP
jgi:hypothetical protein